MYLRGFTPNELPITPSEIKTGEEDIFTKSTSKSMFRIESTPPYFEFSLYSPAKVNILFFVTVQLLYKSQPPESFIKPRTRVDFPAPCAPNIETTRQSFIELEIKKSQNERCFLNFKHPHFASKEELNNEFINHPVHFYHQKTTHQIHRQLCQ